MGLFGNKNNDIKIIKQPPPDACGGTTAYQHKNAPTEIQSEDMILFDVSSALSVNFAAVKPENRSQFLQYIYAFAAPCKGGSFLYLGTSTASGFDAPVTSSWAIVKENVFPSLTALVREYKLAKNNGFHSRTHGLPRNFGGSIDISYSSGETINTSNNQFPVLSQEEAKAIYHIFSKAFQTERIGLPKISELKSIFFEERRKGGGFTEATLTFSPDGTGINSKRAKYDSPTIFESEKPVDVQTMQQICENIEKTALFAWDGLPERPPLIDFSTKRMTFRFDDGSEITIKDETIVPAKIQNGFFNIELEMTTKH